MSLTYALAWLSAALTVALAAAVLTALGVWRHYRGVVARLQWDIAQLVTPEHLRSYRGDLVDRFEDDHTRRARRGRGVHRA